jgi:hypothetical protein
MEWVRRKWLSLDNMCDVDVTISRRPLSSSIMKLHQTSHDATKKRENFRNATVLLPKIFTPLWTKT